MTAALLAAGALLAWPGRPLGVRRVRPVGGPAMTGPAAWIRVAPAAAGALAVLAGAALSTPLVAALAGCCAGLGARSVLAARRRSAEEAALLALAEGVGVLAAELAAGRPVAAAVSTAASGVDERTAALLAAALRDDVRREGAGPPEVARVRAAVRLSGTTGCPLTDVLSAVEDDLRARHRRRLELRTATAGPRAAAALLAALPLLGLAMGAGIGADPWGVLTGTAAGQAVLVTGVLLEAAGVAWTGRLLRRATADRVTGGEP